MMINACSPFIMDNPGIKDAPAPGSWSEQKRKLMVQFPQLTEADFYFDEGKKDEMFTHIRNKVGKSQEDLIYIMSSL